MTVMTHAATDQLSLDTIRLKRIVTVVRWLSILLILAALLMIVRTLPIGQAMEAMKGWIGGLGIWGPVVLALVYVVATVLFVPGKRKWSWSWAAMRRASSTQMRIWTMPLSGSSLAPSISRDKVALAYSEF